MTAPDAALLESYLIRTRWFGGKGRPFEVEQVRSIADVPARQGRPSLTVYLLTVTYRDQDADSELYQVPLSGYPDVEERISHAYLGGIDTDAGHIHLYDAVHDREAMRIWLDGFIAAEATGTAQVDRLRFHRVAGGEPLDDSLISSPMTGEQSNSSARFDDTAIMKLFRKVSPGTNPDIEIHEELTRGGSEHIAQLYGWVEVEVEGQLLQTAMLQEFLATATDGFELAVASVRALLADPEQRAEDSGGDFAGEAARLGEALAQVHALMRSRSAAVPAPRRSSPTRCGVASTTRAGRSPGLRPASRNCTPSMTLSPHLTPSRFSACMATCTSARLCVPRTDGASSTSRVNRAGRSSSALFRIRRGGMSPECCVRSTTRLR